MNPKDYYDDFAGRQLRVGINERHRAIQAWLGRFGLAPGMDVLEVGCGVGTQTQLIAGCLEGSGRLLALDFSPRSVELARERLAGQGNVEFLVADVVELDLDRVFDVIVLPDVIEHIPLERHGRLFAKIRKWLKETGWVLIHMPNPFFQEWCRRHRPDLLQVVDQPIFVEALLSNIQPNGLYIHYLNTYSLWVPECDYQVVVLRVRRDQEFTIAGSAPSLRMRVAAAARKLLGFAWLRRDVAGSGRGEL